MPGDFSWAIKSEDAESDFALFKELKGKKVILRGNHDFWWNTISQVRAILPEGFFAIQNDALKFGNLIVCGSRGGFCPSLTDRLMNATTKFICVKSRESSCRLPLWRNCGRKVTV